jgi:hypothetical protein
MHRHELISTGSLSAFLMTSDRSQVYPVENLLNFNHNAQVDQLNILTEEDAVKYIGINLTRQQTLACSGLQYELHLYFDAMLSR